MHKRAILPDRCFFTGEITTRRWRRNFSWHHPALFLLLPAGLLVFVIIVLILRKTATIDIPISPKKLQAWRINMGVSWAIAAFSLVFFATGAAFWGPPGDEGAGLYLVLIGVAVFLFAVLYGMITTNIVSVKKINDEWVWLRGGCPRFLEMFPEWTGGK